MTAPTGEVIVRMTSPNHRTSARVVHGSISAASVHCSPTQQDEAEQRFKSIRDTDIIQLCDYRSIMEERNEGDKVLSLLQTRKKQGYQREKHDDGNHLALVIEGGGMRGVAAGGMVTGLEEMGLNNCFDTIHGSSSGAATAAYFLCGQADIGTSIFYEDLCDERFLSFKRLYQGKPIMDTGYLVDHVMDRIKKIDFEQLKKKKDVLHILTTDIDKGEPVTWSVFRQYDEYRQALKASMTLPFIAGGPIELRGHRLMDGGLLQHIALSSAFNVGATHVLVLQTCSRENQLRPLPNWRGYVVARLLEAMYGGKMRELILMRNEHINSAVRLIQKGRGPRGQHISQIALEPAIQSIRRLTQNSQDLLNAAKVMRSATVKYCNTTPVQVFQQH